MDLSSFSLRWQRVVALALVPLTALLFWTGAPDTFGLPKATVLWLGAVALLALGLVRIAYERSVSLPRSPWAIATVLLVAAVVAATLASPTVALSVVGEYNRYSGLLSYAAFAVVGLTVLRTFDVDEASLLLRVMTVTAGVVGVYGLSQILNVDLYTIGSVDIGPVATLGNSNLLAGFLAVCVPAAAWVALTRTVSSRWRLVGAGTAVLSLLVALGSRSYQGPVAAIPGVLVVILVWLSTEDGATVRTPIVERVGSARRAVVLAIVAVAVLAVPVVLILGRTALEQGFLERGAFWRAALSMFGSDPVLGTGFDTYGQHFLAERPAGHASRFAYTQAESAHSVPLNLLSGGGLVVGVAWIAVLAVTAWALWRGLRRLDGEERLLVGALGGAWLAYQVQSLVSFDVPELGLLHFALAGAIVAIGVPPRWHRVSLPGAAPQVRGRRGHQRVLVPTSTYALVAVVILVAIVGAWSLTRPLRADLAAGRAPKHVADGDPQAAIASAARATELAPWQGRYWLLRAQYSEASGEVFQAADFAARAARAEPGSSQYALVAARLNGKYREPADGVVWLEAALERDPHNPVLHSEVARIAAANGQLEYARQSADRATSLAPGAYQTWLAVAEVSLAEGDGRAARAAYERVLELSPGNGDAIRGLNKVDEVADGSTT